MDPFSASPTCSWALLLICCWFLEPPTNKSTLSYGRMSYISRPKKLWNFPACELQTIFQESNFMYSSATPIPADVTPTHPPALRLPGRAHRMWRCTDDLRTNKKPALCRPTRHSMAGSRSGPARTRRLCWSPLSISSAS